MSLGCSGYVFEMMRQQHADPIFAIMTQYFRFLHELLVVWNSYGTNLPKENWRNLYLLEEALASPVAKHTWRGRAMHIVSRGGEGIGAKALVQCALGVPLMLR